MSRSANGNQFCRQFLLRRRAAPDYRKSVAQLERCLSINVMPQVFDERTRASFNLRGREADHAQSGNFIKSAATVRRKRRFESSYCEFLHAERAEKRITTDALDEFFPPGDNPPLRAPKQFVSAETNDTGARGETFAHQRFRNPRAAQIGEAAGAEVFEHGNAPLAAERNQFGEIRPI